MSSKAKKVAIIEKEKIELAVLLAHSYDPDKSNCDNWIASHKLDGQRAYYDHVARTFYSRNGNPIYVPEWYLKEMPEVTFDGELFTKNNDFEGIGVVRHKVPIDEDWRRIHYMIFDMPLSTKVYRERLEELAKITFSNKLISVIKTWISINQEQIYTDLDAAEAEGYEGLMLRDPESLYIRKRSKTLLKVKTATDDEAIILSYEEGTGRLKGLTGALNVESTGADNSEIPKGTKFSIGSGLNDILRTNPPAVGTIITFRYNELTKYNVPRFPRFLRIREEE